MATSPNYTHPPPPFGFLWGGGGGYDYKVHLYVLGFRAEGLGAFGAIGALGLKGFWVQEFLRHPKPDIGVSGWIWLLSEAGPPAGVSHLAKARISRRDA